MKFSQLLYCPWWWFQARILGRHIPLQSVIFISDRCNLSCKHCSVYNHRAPVTKTYAQIEEELRYCYGLGSRFVDFEGGEPFLWSDGEHTLDDLCDLAHSLGFFSCTVTTNAQKPFPNAHADSIWVSMDGVGEVHDRIRGEGAFARLEQNVAACGHPALSVNMTVNTLNAGNLDEAMDYVRRSPYIRSISFNLHTPYPGTEYLSPDPALREAILDKIIAFKQKGYPVMNSVSGLKRMKKMRFKKCCWMSNFIFADGSRKSQCIGPEVGNCDRCGFCMAGEQSAVLSLCPDTLLAGLSLRVRE